MEDEVRGVKRGELTERGFRDYIKFRDRYNSEVVVRQSSSAFESNVWIFCKNEDPKYENPHPHLSVEMAKLVIEGLQAFIKDAEGGE